MTDKYIKGKVSQELYCTVCEQKHADIIFCCFYYNNLHVGCTNFNNNVDKICRIYAEYLEQKRSFRKVQIQETQTFSKQSKTNCMF